MRALTLSSAGAVLLFALAAASLEAQDTLETLRQAAEQGDPGAQYGLGFMYADSMSVLEDDAERGVLEDSAAAEVRWYRLYAEAVRWYRMAAEQGHAEAQYELARTYHITVTQEGSRNVPEIAAEMDRWYRMAAEQGHAEAQVIHGSRSDGAVEAVRWYRMAAEQGLAVAQFNLGRAYRDGNGVLKDDSEALRWYRMAAEQGDVGAQFALGSTYSEIALVSRADFLAGRTGDFLELAHMWYNIASANSTGSRAYSLGDVDDTILSTDPGGHSGANAGVMRDGVEGLMTRPQIERATELARTCMASNYRECGP